MGMGPISSHSASRKQRWTPRERRVFDYTFGGGDTWTIGGVRPGLLGGASVSTRALAWPADWLVPCDGAVIVPAQVRTKPSGPTCQEYGDRSRSDRITEGRP